MKHLNSFSKEELIQIIQNNEKDIQKITSERNIYLQELLLLRYRQFAQKSEKLPKEEQLQAWLFNETETHSKEKDTDEERLNIIKVSSHKRRKRGRKPLPSNLPAEEIIHDLSEEEKICSCCNNQLKKIGEDKSEELEYIPAQLKIIRHIRYKYSCSCDENTSGVITPPAPVKLIPKSFSTPSLLAHVMVSKFCDALPFYRQEKIFKRFGIDLPRSTMCNWAVKIHEKTDSLLELMEEELKNENLLLIDETTVQVLKEPGKSAQSQSYMWAFVGGNKDSPVILYKYRERRTTHFLNEFLDNFRGVMLTDGYEAYDKIGQLKGITHAGCWAHVRRKFFEHYEIDPTDSEKPFLKIIQTLYGIEKEIRESFLSSDEILRKRQKESGPIVKDFFNRIIEKSKTIPPKSSLGKAIHYALNQKHKLLVFLENPQTPIDNNFAENIIRPFVVGRKNWLFSDTMKGAHASAAIYSIIQTAILNGLEPYWYLRYLFEKLPFAAHLEDLEKLLPNKVKQDELKKYFGLP